jgi:hypothetical protein
VSEQPFPSGPWEGFYNYEAGGKRHRMELTLTFQDGIVRGSGRDDVGIFHIRGHYDAANGECQCTKTYVGRHEVAYNRFHEGKGIMGTWDIWQRLHGGFHIWPLGAGETQSESAEGADKADALSGPDVISQPQTVRS